MVNRDGNLSSKRSPTRAGVSRRGLLKGAGGTLAGIALASKPIFAADTAPKKIRMGVVGGGNFGKSYFWHLHPDCVVAAVSDLIPERRDGLMKAYNCSKAYNSLEELVKDPDIDAVGVFTDGNLHVRHVVDAMKHGKHAISAVPAAWGSVEDAELLLDTVRKTGLTYMMAETSYYMQPAISVRKFYQEKQFGEVFHIEAEYQHPGLERLYFRDGKRTWRHGMPPMWYPTHCTGFVGGITGERLTEVVCHGWGDGDPILKDNAWKNPFWNESAMFKTDRGHGFRCNVWWKGAYRGTERAQWIGTKMSFYCQSPNGTPAVIVRAGKQTEKDDAGFERAASRFEEYKQTEWWKTDMLPEPLRRNSGHGGSHTFLTNEFIDALVHSRRPAVDIYEALAYTVPGIIAHQSALKGGELLKIPQYSRPA